MNMLGVLARSMLAGLDLALLGLLLLLVRLLTEPAPVPLTLFGLLVAFVLGALSAATLRRWEPHRAARLISATLGLATALLLVKGGLITTYWPFTGWDLLSQPLLHPADPASGRVYAALLFALVAIWRGTRLHTVTLLAELQASFKRGLVLLVILMVAAVLLPDPYRVSARLAATGAAILYVVTGLLAQALFRETSGIQHDQQLAWRKLFLLGAALSLPLAFTLALATWFSEDAAALMTRVYRAIVALILVLIAPVMALVFSLLSALARLLLHPGSGPLEPPLPLQRPIPSPLPPLSTPPDLLPGWLAAVLPLLPFLVPIFALLILLLLRPKRALPSDTAAEERESVWSWQTAGRDLAALWQLRKRRQDQVGLARALARLHSDDPVHVIRRTYLRLLIHMHHRGQTRDGAQTPAEYAPTLERSFVSQQVAIEDLTRGYERARYHPEATTPADATAAVAAWDRLSAASEQPVPQHKEANT
ncbi:MAG: DUF4129 domain-containing protein [Herpetosiphonaceae bacterium]|nr:DUF4129 domain-containing protein [Herpetosiphonaceae bacterium]